MPRTPGIACPPQYVASGEGSSAQCCQQSAIRCTTRSANASCSSGEIPIQDGSVSACCRQDPAGICVPPSTPTPNIDVVTTPAGSKKCGGWVWVPVIGFICQISDRDRDARVCYADDDCPVGTACRDGSCVEQGVAQPNAVPASAACQPPSVPVSGTCCTAESVAAGTCGAPSPVCLGGKVLVNNACRCPAGTVENTKSGKCETPKPAAVQKQKPVPAKPKEIVCQKGFHVERWSLRGGRPAEGHPGIRYSDRDRHWRRRAIGRRASGQRRRVSETPANTALTRRAGRSLAADETASALLARDRRVEGDVFLAAGAAAQLLDPFQSVMRRPQVVLLDTRHAVIGQGQQVVWISGERLVVP